jgi:hypothetical protein
LLSAELDIWSKAYIDVNEIVRQNSVLRKEVNSYSLLLKSLKEKCAGLERQRQNAQIENETRRDLPRDSYRWVEGSSDTESCDDSVEDGEIVENKMKIVRNNNKVIISCNNEYLPPCTPIKQRQMTESDSDYCLKTKEKEGISNVRKRREKQDEHKVTRIGIRNPDPQRTCRRQTKQQGGGNQRFAEKQTFSQIINNYPEPAMKLIQHGTSEENEATTDNTRSTTKKGRQTALNRCKSFLGLKTDNAGYEKSPEYPFVLKSKNVNGKQRPLIKRSKSMDMSKMNVLRDPTKNDQSLFMQKNWNKLEYVKKWQKDILYFDKTNQLEGIEMEKNTRSERNDNSQELNQSFYCLYFSPKNLQKHKLLTEDSVDSLVI